MSLIKTNKQETTTVFSIVSANEKDFGFEALFV